MKKVGKTSRPFRYDLNQIPYDYTVEVTNRFKGQDMIDRVPDELWTEVCDIIQETGIKTIPIEKCKKAKWLSEEAVQIAVKRREVKSKGEKERYKHLNADLQRMTRRLSYLFLLFFGTLHSDAYIFPFLLCFSLLFFSQLFVRPPQTAILLLVT